MQAISHTAERYQRLLDKVFSEAADSGQAAVTWFDWAARALEKTDFADGCPIGTVACEIASSNEALREASRAVFDSWESRVTGELMGAGVSPARARRLATFAVASLEGAIMLARVQRSTRPLRDTGRVVAETLCAATELH